MELRLKVPRAAVQSCFKLLLRMKARWDVVEPRIDSGALEPKNEVLVDSEKLNSGTVSGDKYERDMTLRQLVALAGGIRGIGAQTELFVDEFRDAIFWKNQFIRTDSPREGNFARLEVAGFINPSMRLGAC